jgi:RNA polymerase sigma-70 factor (ECF subfamily)
MGRIESYSIRSGGTARRTDELDAPGSDPTSAVLARARGGDRSAVRTLIERAVPALRRWSHGRIPKYGRGSADTEDVVQEAVLKTLKRIDTFEPRTVDALQSFLRTAVINQIRDILRRVGRRGVPSNLPDDLPDSAQSPLEQAIMREQMDRFLEALQQLRPVDRQLIVWRIELGYSHEEIGHHLGKTPMAARLAVRRAEGRLAKALQIGAGPDA